MGHVTLTARIIVNIIHVVVGSADQWYVLSNAERLATLNEGHFRSRWEDQKADGKYVMRELHHIMYIYE